MAQIAKDVAGAAVPATARDTIHSFDLAFLKRGADLAWENDRARQSCGCGGGNFKLQI